MQVEILGLDALMRKFGSAKVSETIHQATLKSVLYVHSQIPAYPPPPLPGSFEFVSDKQRRYVMWAIKAGTIQVPYRRRHSGGIGGSITTKVSTLGRDMVGTIGTNMVYAPWVISDRAIGDRGPQARIHQGRWWTLQGVFKAAQNSIVEIYRQAIRSMIRGG
jgi:hypothetical protein